jgi:hypothetical protein
VCSSDLFSFSVEEGRVCSYHNHATCFNTFCFLLIGTGISLSNVMQIVQNILRVIA